MPNSKLLEDYDKKFSKSKLNIMVVYVVNAIIFDLWKKKATKILSYFDKL